MAGITPPAIQTYQMKASSYGLWLVQVGKQLFKQDRKLKLYRIKIEIWIINDINFLELPTFRLKINNT